jgi:hypothetical protein
MLLQMQKKIQLMKVLHKKKKFNKNKTWTKAKNRWIKLSKLKSYVMRPHQRLERKVFTQRILSKLEIKKLTLKSKLQDQHLKQQNLVH